MSSKVSVIVLAAGLGTRMKSRLAKVLHRAGGICLLEHVVRAARTVAVPENIIAVVGHQAERVQAEVAPYGIQFQVQAEQLGTGHAVLSCASHPAVQDGLVIVVYGDGPLLSGTTLQKLLEAHSRSGCSATQLTTHLADPTGYGRILKDEEGYVSGIVEEKAATDEQKKMTEINPGIYCFEARVLWTHLRQLTPNPASGEYYLTDIVELMRNAGYKTAALAIENANEVLGINTRAELADVDRILKDRKTRELMLAGVTIERPETVCIDMDVEVGMDTVIGPHAVLTGRTKIGQGTLISAGCVLQNAEVGNDVELYPYTVIQDSRLGDGAHAGPFTRFRPGSVLESEAHVGNFVELKNTTLGAGSKAMHLSYLGDSKIGSKTNIGAGTITCNYDGVKKHKTHIGSGAFVGSNSTLVAPLEIGDGSYIGAGSVITKPVPADALAVAREREVIKEGWAKARRERSKKL